MARDLSLLKDRVCAAIEEHKQELIDLSLRIHDHPELAFAEVQASQWLSECLQSAGFNVEKKAHGVETAFATRIGSGRPVVAILAEYDALPGIGHGCGHNIIGTAAIGAGIGLKAVIGDTGGTVTVLGTPAEERGGGKILMARNGAFADVDAAMMIHPAGINAVELNAIAFTQIDVEYFGKAAHAAAMPHQGINALDALVIAYNAIAALRQHIRGNERIHGIITDGGQAPNVVPEHTAGRFYVRAANEEKLGVLKERVLACFRAGAEATGARLTHRWLEEQYSELITNQPLVQAFQKNAESLSRAFIDPRRSATLTGSTDMGNVSKLVPAIHPLLACSPPGVPIHSAEFATWTASEEAHKALLDGAKALAMTAIDVLCQPELLTEVKRAFASGG